MKKPRNICVQKTRAANNLYSLNKMKNIIHSLVERHENNQMETRMSHRQPSPNLSESLIHELYKNDLSAV